mmetsp:Transcript_16752/g.48203  ORF Transcript_16752/g.48203 Transcript_16752/m.48203 type:complete len:307 (+) Transcript_16752:2342-3262(+)
MSFSVDLPFPSNHQSAPAGGSIRNQAHLPQRVDYDTPHPQQYVPLRRGNERRRRPVVQFHVPLHHAQLVHRGDRPSVQLEGRPARFSRQSQFRLRRRSIRPVLRRPPLLPAALERVRDARPHVRRRPEGAAAGVLPPGRVEGGRGVGRRLGAEGDAAGEEEDGRRVAPPGEAALQRNFRLVLVDQQGVAGGRVDEDGSPLVDGIDVRLEVVLGAVAAGRVLVLAVPSPVDPLPVPPVIPRRVAGVVIHLPLILLGLLVVRLLLGCDLLRRLVRQSALLLLRLRGRRGGGLLLLLAAEGVAVMSLFS